MNSHEMIEALKVQASEKHKASVIRMGIPEESCIGVSTADVRKFAKKTEKSNELAVELWNTGYHEARLLAVLLFEHRGLTHADIDKLMSEVVSWDLCDHLCKNLIIKRKDYGDFISEWILSSHIYKKRAAFTLMASAAIHDKGITDDTLDAYLKLIKEHSDSGHAHIKKAVSWALREIGKKDFTYNEKALILAHELLETGGKTQVWIAKDAIKELETVVKADGRARLISVNSGMGKGN